MQQNIVILGAGYGGLRVTRRLSNYISKDGEYQLVLVNKHNYHMFMTQLHEHAVGTSDFNDTMVSLDEVLDEKKVKFIKGWVDDVDTKNKIVLVNNGEIKIPYQYLCVALGSEPEYYNIEGLRKHSMCLRSLYSAREIRRKVEKILEEASGMPSGEMKKQKLTFVVGGGGLTGVEFAGELAYQLRRIRDQYDIKENEYKIIVIEGAEELLSGMSEDLSDYAENTLKEMGVQIITGEFVKKVTSDTVFLTSDKEIKYSLFVWSGGVRGNKVLQKSDLRTDKRGRLPVNKYLQYQEDSTIYAVGDSAFAKNPNTKKPVVPTAQAALQQGEVAGYNIFADIKGQEKKEYHPVTIGTLVSIGRGRGLGKVKTFKLKGISASWLKELVPMKYLYSLGGLKMVTDSLYK